MPTQPQEDEGGDDVYLDLARAITERKCRIEQKKEKLKFIINQIKKQNDVLKSSTVENNRLKNEMEEVIKQKNIRVQNINNAKEIRETLEATLCDLTNQVTLERAETQRKNYEYDAAIKDAWDTWEIYKEKYENLPLAKKLQEVKVEVKKVEIALKIAKMDIGDMKMKKKMKHNIAEKRFQMGVVKLAEKYKVYQKEVEENLELLEKIKEMKKLLADLETGKTTRHQIQQPHVSARPSSNKEQPAHTQPETLKFTIPGMQISSPTPPANESELSGGRKLLDWGNLLGSTGVLSFSRKPAEKSVNPSPIPSANKQLQPSKQSLPRPVINLQAGSQKEKTLYGSKMPGSSLKLTSLLRNVPSSHRKPETSTGIKRHIESETNSKANKEDKALTKKACTGNEGFSHKNNSNGQNQQFEEIPKLLEPGSPTPDMIPMETNTEAPSQGNDTHICSPINFNLSGSSDFISPDDFDEATKAVNERMKCQGPYIREFSEKTTMSFQKPVSEERVVRSQYFTGDSTLYTQPNPTAADCPLDQQPFSPPLMDTDYASSPQLVGCIPSPPPATTGRVRYVFLLSLNEINSLSIPSQNHCIRDYSQTLI